MTDDDVPRRRDWLDGFTDELFGAIDVRFWQLAIISFLLGFALMIAFLAAAS